MKKNPLFSIIVILFAYGYCVASIINIPGDYLSIQQGIDSSEDNDTVLVQPGTYIENIDFDGHNITLGSLYLTTGDSSYISTTTIDGDSAGAVITLSAFEAYTSVITGFTITNGGGVQGGGIICDGSNPRIIRNIITGNFGTYGGGIVCDMAGPLITGNIISGNYGERGGGIYLDRSDPIISQNSITGNMSSGIGCYRSQPKITGNTFTGNFAELGGAIYCENCPDALISDNYISRHFNVIDGGGIYFNMSDATVSGNIIAENMSERGGGIYCRQSFPLIRGNIFSRNLGEFSGGGLFLFQSDPFIANNILEGNLSSYGAGLTCRFSDPVLLNNTVTGNMADISGGGIYNFYSVPIITNSIFWENSASTWPEIYNYSGSSAITYSDIQGGWEGQGNIDIDPLFRSPDNGDFHLMSFSCGDSIDSPCIDSGHPNLFDSLLDCSWGLGTSLGDMGAYGGGGDSVSTAVFDSHVSLPGSFESLQNYPNPFNAVTTITFVLLEPMNVRLTVFDMLGCKVETLVEGEKPAGRHQVAWDADGYSSGLYFCRFQAGSVIESKRMLLLK